MNSCLVLDCTLIHYTPRTKDGNVSYCLSLSHTELWTLGTKTPTRPTSFSPSVPRKDLRESFVGEGNDQTSWSVSPFTLHRRVVKRWTTERLDF